MKKLLNFLALAVLALGFSSCSSMFGSSSSSAEVHTEPHQVRTFGYETVTEEVHTGGKGGMVEFVRKCVPRYKTVNKKVKTPCPTCTRYYRPGKDCCGTTSESAIKSATAQGPVGSPHIGLVPTMRKIAE